MKPELLKDEEMYVLYAPDGSPQPMTLAPDLAMCTAMIKLLYSKGIGKSYHETKIAGWQILPVKVSIVPTGTEEEGFQKFKKEINQ